MDDTDQPYFNKIGLFGSYSKDKRSVKSAPESQIQGSFFFSSTRNQCYFFYFLLYPCPCVR